jgi:RND family efflux transporter MFP subunit
MFNFSMMGLASPVSCLVTLCLIAVAQRTHAQSEFPARGTDPVIGECPLRVVDDIEVPATEAGVLVQLDVDRGSRVKENDVIGKVDDRQATVAKEVAEWAVRAAYARATDKVEVEYSQKAAEVAEADHDELLESNKITEKAVTETDIRRAKLEWDRSLLATEKAEHDLRIAGFDYRTKMAELEAAKLALNLRIIRAPFDGEVVEIIRHQGEWVSPGDPILRLIRMDTLYVDGSIQINEYDYNDREIDGCEVTVHVQIGDRFEEDVKGRIIWVSPMIDEGIAQYSVRAEIPNQLVDGRWRIRPGVLVSMKIHLGTNELSISQRE